MLGPGRLHEPAHLLAELSQALLGLGGPRELLGREHGADLERGLRAVLRELVAELTDAAELRLQVGRLERARSQQLGAMWRSAKTSCWRRGSVRKAIQIRRRVSLLIATSLGAGVSATRGTSSRRAPRRRNRIQPPARRRSRQPLTATRVSQAPQFARTWPSRSAWCAFRKTSCTTSSASCGLPRRRRHSRCSRP